MFRFDHFPQFIPYHKKLKLLDKYYDKIAYKNVLRERTKKEREALDKIDEVIKKVKEEYGEVIYQAFKDIKPQYYSFRVDHRKYFNWEQLFIHEKYDFESCKENLVGLVEDTSTFKFPPKYYDQDSRINKEKILPPIIKKTFFKTVYDDKTLPEVEGFKMDEGEQEPEIERDEIKYNSDVIDNRAGEMEKLDSSSAEYEKNLKKLEKQIKEFAKTVEISEDLEKFCKSMRNLDGKKKCYYYGSNNASFIEIEEVVPVSKLRKHTVEVLVDYGNDITVCYQKILIFAIAQSGYGFFAMNYKDEKNPNVVYFDFEFNGGIKVADNILDFKKKLEKDREEDFDFSQLEGII